MMKSEILKLKNKGGFQGSLPFSPYISAVESIPSLGDTEDGGRDLVSKIEAVFFEKYLASYSDHIESVRTADSILPCILGGNPRLAQLFVNWTFHYYESSGANKDGNVDEFEWTNKLVDLEGRATAGQEVPVNTVVCMNYLTATLDSIKMLDYLIIKGEIYLLWKLGCKGSPVDLFHRMTWNVKDYTLLKRTVHTMLTIYPTQNQCVENHVQLAALVCKTNIGEARATAHAMMHYYLIWRYNMDSGAK